MTDSPFEVLPDHRPVTLLTAVARCTGSLLSKQAVPARTRAQPRLQARAQGYAERLPAHLSDREWDTDLRAIAVPIKARGQVLGGISVLWLRTYKPVQGFAALHLEALQQAARDINAALDLVWDDTPG